MKFAALTLYSLVLCTLVITTAFGQHSFWQPITPPGGIFDALAVDSAGRLFVSTSADGHLLSDLDDMLLLSNDGGTTWHQRTEPIFSYVIAATNDALIAGSSRRISGNWYNYINRSTDGGLTWNLITDSLPSAVNSIIVPRPDEVIAGLDQHGIIRSTDGGRSFPVQQLDGITVLKLVVANDRTIYAATTTGLYLSRDHGTTWNHPGTDSSTLWDIAVGGNGFLVAMGDSLRGSVDGGASWKTIPGMEGKHIYNMAFAPNGDLVVVSSDQNEESIHIGISSDQGATWHRSAYNGRYVGALLTYGNSIFAAAANGVYRSDDNGKSWQLLSAGFGTPRLYVVAANDALLAVGSVETADTLHLHRSTDGGAAWKVIAGLPDPLEFYTIVASPRGPLFAIHMGRLFRSTDFGTMWQQIDYPDSNGGRSIKWKLLSAIAVAPDGTIYLSLRTPENDLVFVASTDDGASWNEIKVDAPPDYGFEYTFFTGPFLGYHGEIAFNRGKSIDYSFDRGKTWQTFSPVGLPFETRAIYFHPAGYLFLLTYGNFDLFRLDPATGIVLDCGIQTRWLTLTPDGTLVALGTYASPDTGRTWRIVDTSSTARMYTLASDSHGTLYSIDEDAGLVRSNRSVSGVQDERAADGLWQSNINVRVNAEQIVVELGETRGIEADIEIVNMLGNLVLPSNTTENGHAVVDISSLPAGAYVCCVRAPGVVRSFMVGVTR